MKAPKTVVDDRMYHIPIVVQKSLDRVVDDYIPVRFVEYDMVNGDYAINALDALHDMYKMGVWRRENNPASHSYEMQQWTIKFRELSEYVVDTLYGYGFAGRDRVSLA